MSGARRDQANAALWDDPVAHPLSMGCASCVEYEMCGGLHVSNAFDCLTYCCGKPDSCDSVCPNNPEFVERIQEIDGFDLRRLARAAGQEFPELPTIAPLIYSKGRRTGGFYPKVATLSLYQLLDRRTFETRFETPDSLRLWFGLDLRTKVILSGTEEDKPLERWWRMGPEKRASVLASIHRLRIAAATGPNFSVFSDVPRFDDFHSMKRIAICQREMSDAGIPTALHVNGRTSQDFQRWTEFVQDRPEIGAIAYEFGTGAGAARRTPFHVEELKHLADRVERPLNLIVRGAVGSIAELRMSFASVTMIDTTTYMRTAHRFTGTIRKNGVITWSPCRDRPDVNMDQLLEHNYLTVCKASSVRDAPKETTQSIPHKRRRLR